MTCKETQDTIESQAYQNESAELLTQVKKYVAGHGHLRLAIAETAGIQTQYAEEVLAMSVLQILQFQAMLDIYFDQLILIFEMISTK